MTAQSARLRYLAFALSLVAVGCKSDASDDGGADASMRQPVAYEWIEYEGQEPVDNIPDLTWTTFRRYPFFKSDAAGLNLDAINAHLHTLSRQPDCDDKGERSFVMNVEHAGFPLISLTYEDMWQCPQMPSPSSRSGVVNFDAKSGTEVSILDDLLPGRRAELTDLVISHMQTTSDVEPSCAGVTKIDGAFRHQNDIVFNASPVDSEPADCRYPLPLTKVRPFLKSDSLFAVPAQQ